MPIVPPTCDLSHLPTQTLNLTKRDLKPLDSHMMLILKVKQMMMPLANRTPMPRPNLI